MGKERIKMILTVLILILLTACNIGKSGNKFEITEEVKNGGHNVKGAVLKVANIRNSAYSGVFYSILNTDYDENSVIFFTDENIFYYKSDGTLSKGGIAEATTNIDKKKITVRIKKDVKWSDGVPLTIDDYIYTYEVMGHKDYFSPEAAEVLRKHIVGGEDYYNGKSDKISGIKKVDDKTAEISVIDFSPDNRSTAGNLLIDNVLPKHYLKDIPVKDLPNSERIKQKMVTIGPYIPVSITNEGKTVILEANRNYYKGVPKIEKVMVEATDRNNILKKAKNGQYDIITVYQYLYENLEKLNNITLVNEGSRTYKTLIFNIGYYDENKKQNITDPNKKMTDIKLREALAYGTNVDDIIKEYYNSGIDRTTGIVPSVFGKAYDVNVKNYPYDPEKAKQLLDEAGYRDIDGDGYREDKNGQPFELRVTSMDPYYEQIKTYMKNWEYIGLKSIFVTGDFEKDVNTYFKSITKGNNDIDVYYTSLKMNSMENDNFHNTYSMKGTNNYSHFTSEKLEKIVEEITGNKSLKNPKYRIKMINEFQKYYLSQLPEIPLMNEYSYFALNKRVKGYKGKTDDPKYGIHLWELTANDPIKAKN